ncbi:MAG: quinone-dependent dihydroorotate dehydrogenase [Prevotellaceae bacterium]|jgi:dihydroorotate dehydrogenase|nr:quinone-dependent dihydroorotate dehydrogenase [Prevotellaceae bacterium]
MYKLIRPILFLFSPETIHHSIVNLLRISKFIPFCSSIIRGLFKRKTTNLEREVFGIRFSNPLGFAAGFDKNAEIVNQLADFGYSFIEVGTVTPQPQPGNPKPRCFRLPENKAIINRMGFNSKGVDYMLRKLAKFKRRKGVVIGGNIGKNTVTANDEAPADYTYSFVKLYSYVDYFTVNISCPNVTDLCKLQNKDSIEAILTPLMGHRKTQEVYKPILVKLSPDLTLDQVDEQLDAAIALGIDGVVAVNTTTSREDIDPQKAEKVGSGGLSGAPLTKRALEMVSYISQKTESKLPIVGVGGIMTEDDAVNMLKAGASLIQLYTGFIYQGPSFVKRINKRLIREL